MIWRTIEISFSPMLMCQASTASCQSTWFCLQDLFARRDWVEAYLAGHRLSCLESTLVRQMEVKHWEPFSSIPTFAPVPCFPAINPEQLASWILSANSVTLLHATLWRHKFPEPPSAGFMGIDDLPQLPQGLLPGHWDDELPADLAPLAFILINLMLEFTSSSWPMPSPMELALLAVHISHLPKNSSKCKSTFQPEAALGSATDSSFESMAACLSDSESEGNNRGRAKAHLSAFADIGLGGDFNAVLECAWALIPDVKHAFAPRTATSSVAQAEAHGRLPMHKQPAILAKNQRQHAHNLGFTDPDPGAGMPLVHLSDQFASRRDCLDDLIADCTTAAARYSYLGGEALSCLAAILNTLRRMRAECGNMRCSELAPHLPPGWAGPEATTAVPRKTLSISTTAASGSVRTSACGPMQQQACNSTAASSVQALHTGTGSIQPATSDGDDKAAAAAALAESAQSMKADAAAAEEADKAAAALIAEEAQEQASAHCKRAAKQRKKAKARIKNATAAAQASHIEAALPGKTIQQHVGSSGQSHPCINHWPCRQAFHLDTDASRLKSIARPHAVVMLTRRL